MQTSEPGVYAIGDIVLGTPQLAHVGAMEGIVAITKIAGKKGKPINPEHIPNATYCHPEIGSVGLTEAKAEEAGYNIKVGKFPFTANSAPRSSASMRDSSKSFLTPIMARFWECTSSARRLPS